MKVVGTQLPLAPSVENEFGDSNQSLRLTDFTPSFPKSGPLRTPDSEDGKTEGVVYVCPVVDDLYSFTVKTV